MGAGQPGGDGTLPRGGAIAGAHGWQKRWGRLVKNAGLTGALDGGTTYRPALADIGGAHNVELVYLPTNASWLNWIVRHEVACDEWNSSKEDRLMSMT
jgi:hypothetical protein